MIPQYFIDDIIAAADIVATINSRVGLRKQGSSYVASCPFHDEKTPSFNVIPEKRFYYCHGCGAHGNVIGFLMEYDRMAFPEAVQQLADDLGFTVPTQEDKQEKTHTTADLSLLKKVDSYYQACLRKSAAAIDYLKSRGLDGHIAKQFHLGFAPGGWDNLIKVFGGEISALEGLKRNGLVLKKEDKSAYDRFRNRIMFPIKNTQGDVIAFGGRALADENPKYMNSPETPLFHKSFELYGLYEVLQKARSPANIILVEGYMDVIALHQYGIDNVVASLGTATNLKHLQKLFRYSHELIFCFDGDAAGKKAAWRALLTYLGAMREGVQLRFMFLPDNEDPDTLVRRIGKQGFLQRVDHAQPLSQVFFDLLEKDIPLKTPDAKAQFANKALSYLNRIPKGIFRELMIAELAKRIKVYVNDLHSDEKLYQRKVISQTSLMLNPVQKLIALLLQEPKLSLEPVDIERLQAVDSPNVPLFVNILQLLQKNPSISVGEIMAHFEDEVMQQEIAMLAAKRLPFTAEDILVEFNAAIVALEEAYVDQELERLVEQSRKGELSDTERKRLSRLLTEKQERRV